MLNRAVSPHGPDQHTREYKVDTACLPTIRSHIDAHSSDFGLELYKYRLGLAWRDLARAWEGQYNL